MAPQMGPSIWEQPSCPLAKLYPTLMAHKDSPVIQALIAKLPDLAITLGPEAAAAQLLPPLLALLPSRLADVAGPLCQGMVRLLQALPVECYGQLLALLPMMVEVGEQEGGR